MRTLPFALTALALLLAGCADDDQENTGAGNRTGGSGGELNGRVDVVDNENVTARETAETNATPESAYG